MANRLRFWRRGIPVVLLLLALALPPLAGAAGFVSHDVREAQDARDLTVKIASDTEAVLEVFELRIALLDEYNWSLITRGLVQFGLRPSDMDTVIGIDPVAEVERARIATDIALNRVGDTDLRDAVLTHRGVDGAVMDVLLSFQELEQIAKTALETEIDGLRTAAGRADDDGSTLDSIAVLESVGEAQHSMASAVTNFFGTSFGTTSGEGVSELHRMEVITDWLGYDEALDAFRRTAAPQSIAAAWRALTTIPEFVRYTTALDEIVTDIIAGQEASTNLTTDLDTTIALFTDAAAVVVAHQNLLDLAADDVRERSDDLSASARAESDATVRSLLLLLAMTLGVGLLISYLIVRPTRRLAAGAERIREGDTSHRIPVRGPAELRDAALALNGAAATLDLVEEQAKKMTDGSLAPDEVTKATPGPLGDSLRSAMETLAESIREREELRSELAHEAAHDGLTGLPNRTAVLARLDAAVARSRRNGNHVAVMFLDLDGFKQVNDQLGHRAGDTVLTTVADRLRVATRNGDVIGRLGGDEFLLVAEPVSDVEQARTIAARMVEAVARPIDVDSGSVSVGVSVGVAVCGETCAEPAELLHAADVAVYEAKSDERNAIIVAGQPAEQLICPVG